MTAQETIEATTGKFFRVLFTKKSTGELRVMNARLGVTRHLKGGSLAYNPVERNNLIVWDAQLRAYRTIALDNVVEVQCGQISWRKES